MKGLVLFAAMMPAALTSCISSKPPACNDSAVLALVEELVEENASAVFDQYVPSNDPMLLLRYMSLGIGMTHFHTFYIPTEQAKKISWEFSNTRTTALDEGARIRSCAATVSFGNEQESVGTFTLPYSVGFNDDGDVLVSL